MKKFELSAYGVEEMNQKEMVATDGGFFVTAVISICIAALLVSEM